MDGADPERRRQRLVQAIVAARKADERVVFEADDGDDGSGDPDAHPVRVAYEDRTLRLELAADRRDALESLLSEYHVFKIQQPETRKAEDGVVCLSAVTDPKHAADFVEALFRDVYGRPEGYGLRIEA